MKVIKQQILRESQYTNILQCNIRSSVLGQKYEMEPHADW